jgi:hypothetical protein
MNSKHLEHAKIIQKTMGGNIDIDRIIDVLTIAEDQRYLFHGVKLDKDYQSVQQNGVLPHNGHLGNGQSFWNLGARAFGEAKDSGWFGYNSSFFHYAGCSEQNRSTGTLAIAKADDLSAKLKLPKFVDGESTIDVPVPRSHIELLRVELAHGRTNYQAREYGQLSEQAMFELVEDALKRGYEPGKLSKIAKTL